jgi:hypothetical protein
MAEAKVGSARKEVQHLWELSKEMEPKDAHWVHLSFDDFIHIHTENPCTSGSIGDRILILRQARMDAVAQEGARHGDQTRY